MEEKNKKSLSYKILSYFAPKGIQLDMLRYKPNKISYTCGLLAAVFLALGFCVFYSTTGLPSSEKFSFLGSSNAGPFLGIDIVINILMMLFLFFVSMEIQAYSIVFGGVSIGLGAFQIIRSFLLPLSLRLSGAMSVAVFTCVLIFYVFSGALSIIGGILSIIRGNALRKYLLTVKPIENEKVGK